MQGKTLTELEPFMLNHKPQLATFRSAQDILLDHKPHMDKLLLSQDTLQSNHLALATTCPHHHTGTTNTLKEYHKKLNNHDNFNESFLYNITLMQNSNTDMQVSLCEYMGKQDTTSSIFTPNHAKLSSPTLAVQCLIDTVTDLSPTVQKKNLLRIWQLLSPLSLSHLSLLFVGPRIKN